MKGKAISKQFYCHNCHAQSDSWDEIRAHTLEAHGREPYLDRDKRYPSPEIKALLNNPELILAA